MAVVCVKGSHGVGGRIWVHPIRWHWNSSVLSSRTSQNPHSTHLRIPQNDRQNTVFFSENDPTLWPRSPFFQKSTLRVISLNCFNYTILEQVHCGRCWHEFEELPWGKMLPTMWNVPKFSGGAAPSTPAKAHSLCSLVYVAPLPHTKGSKFCPEYLGTP